VDNYKSIENFDGAKITVRPSGVDGAFGCALQWARVHIGGENGIPGARAAIGTAIHASAEVCWTDAIKTGQKDAKFSKLTDAAIASFQEQDKEGLQYDAGEDKNTAESVVIQGVDAFLTDIVPFVDIPTYVEKRFTVKLDNPIFESVSGMVDYLDPTTLSDLKTSRRKPSPGNHVTQQSIYKFLAEENGHPVKYATIQGIALTKQPQGHIVALEPNIPQAKFLINTMLDAATALNSGVDPKLLYKGNPKYMFCSPKYCAFHGTCGYAKGDVK
jgi:hypothetical protein